MVEGESLVKSESDSCLGRVTGGEHVVDVLSIEFSGELFDGGSQLREAQ